MLLDIESHPAWVCGLKRTGVRTDHRACQSHPAWVCGLKPRRREHGHIRVKGSHPAWVCGLKPNHAFVNAWYRGVTPCVGVWIETRQYHKSFLSCIVTPCVGVWIETKKQQV